jgi:hypothetical protein
MRLSNLWYATSSNFLSAFLAFISFGFLARSLSSQDFGRYILIVSLATLFADLIDFGAGLKIIIDSRNNTTSANLGILRRNLEVKIALILFLLPFVLLTSIISRNFFVILCYVLTILFFLRNNCLTIFRSIDKIKSFGSIILVDKIFFLLFFFLTPKYSFTFLLLQSFTLSISIFYGRRKGIQVISKPAPLQGIIPSLKNSLQLGLGSALSNVNLIFPILIGALFGYSILAEYSFLLKTLLPVQIIGSSLAMLRVKHESPLKFNFPKRNLSLILGPLIVGVFIMGLIYLVPVGISEYTLSRYNFSHWQVGMAVFVVFCQQILSYKSAGLQAVRKFSLINYSLCIFIIGYSLCLVIFRSIPKVDTLLIIESSLTAILTIAYTCFLKR